MRARRIPTARLFCAASAAALLLAGCQSQPHKLATPHNWTRIDSDSYVNNTTGVEISRDRYADLVASEVYLSMQGITQGKSWCELNGYR
jgi:hypothetical protein